MLLQLIAEKLSFRGVVRVVGLLGSC